MAYNYNTNDTIRLAQEEYDARINFAIQQKTSKLQYALNVHTMNATRKRFNMIGQIDSKEITSKYGSTSPDPAVFYNRWIFAKPYKVPTVVAKEDMPLIGTTESPIPAIQASHIFALGRDLDTVGYQGITGDAYTGEHGEIVLPYNERQSVPVGHVHEGNFTASGFTVDKLLEGLRMLANAQCYGQDTDPQDLSGPPVICVLSSRDWLSLMNDPKYIESTYRNNLPYDTNGFIRDFMGVRFIMLPDEVFEMGTRPLGTRANPTAGTAVNNVRTCVLFCRDAVVAARDTMTPFRRVSELENNEYNIQIYSRWGLGAGRLEDKGVVKIYTTDTRD